MIYYNYKYLGWKEEECVKFFMTHYLKIIRHIHTYQELRMNNAHEELKEEHKIKIRSKRSNRYINSWVLDKYVANSQIKSWKHVSKCKKQYMKKENYKGNKNICYFIKENTI